jgi:hypothetical protein
MKVYLSNYILMCKHELSTPTTELRKIKKVFFYFFSNWLLSVEVKVLYFKRHTFLVYGFRKKLVRNNKKTWH